jgi:hypothetical protein
VKCLYTEKYQDDDGEVIFPKEIELNLNYARFEVFMVVKI